jgi:hypothetical protein
LARFSKQPKRSLGGDAGCFYTKTRFGARTHGSSRHTDASHWPTQPSDNKIVFLGIIVFHLEAKIIKLKAGHGGFLCQCAKAFSANMMVLLKMGAILLPRPPLALRSICDPPHLSIKCLCKFSKSPALVSASSLSSFVCFRNGRLDEAIALRIFIERVAFVKKCL